MRADMSKETTPEQDKAMAQRQRALDAAMLQIQKDFGENAIVRLGDHKTMEVEVIPTGNILIDRTLGVGGFPRGRVVEIFGPESSGKTTLTLTVIAQAQKAGGLAAFSFFVRLQGRLPWYVQGLATGLVTCLLLNMGPDGVLPFIYFGF